MNYGIEISTKAEADLRGIYEYIAFTLFEPENAGRQLERLEENIMGLSSIPKRFRRYEKEPWHSRGLRMMPVDNFVIFYMVDEKMKVATIIRVIYGGRNMDVELRK